MKKTTILLIIIIYLASIVAIGFFGMKVKVYDKVKYVESINMIVESEDDSMYVFTALGKDEVTKNNSYKLVIDFSKAKKAEFESEDGIKEEKLYIPLSLIPSVTYQSGDIAEAGAESIKYSISDESLIEKGQVSLSNSGMLMVFKKKISFYIYINPEKSAGVGTGAIVQVFVKETLAK